MMKTKVKYRAILTVILGIIIFPSYGQVDSQALNKQWIAVKCRYALGSNWISTIEGNILAFNNHSFESYFFWNDSLVEHAYVLKENIIKINDSLEFGEILNLTVDSLVILDKKATMITTYLPIINSDHKVSKRKLDTLLTNNFWTKPYDDGNMQIDFWDDSAFTPQIKYCTAFIDNEYELSQEGGYWSSFEFDGNTFFSLPRFPWSYYETDFYQIYDIDTSEITMRIYSIYCNESISLTAVPNLSDHKYKELKELLISKDWRINSIQETYQYYGLDNRWPDESIIPIIRQRREGLLKKDFLHKELIYKFSANSSYSISSDKYKLCEGKWYLLKSGEYICLTNYPYISHCLKILAYNDKEIIIRQIIELKESKKTNENNIYDFIIKLN